MKRVLLSLIALSMLFALPVLAADAPAPAAGCALEASVDFDAPLQSMDLGTPEAAPLAGGCSRDCEADYRQCLVICSKNPCLISCEDQRCYCYQGCGEPCDPQVG